jgi:predicted RNase H-like HicB family nuclease
MKGMNIEYTVQIWSEGDQFVAHAMPLNVMSSGQTLEEARAALDEAVRVFLITAADQGSLEEILYEAGYRLRGGEWVSPSWVTTERHSAQFQPEYAPNNARSLAGPRKGFSGGGF